MGKPRIPVDVKFFCAITFSDIGLYEEAKQYLENHFGEIEIISAIFDFNFTKYYYKEMGGNLKKQLLSFKKLHPPDRLPDFKLVTNEIEDKFTRNEKRKINLDPGYLSPGKIVLATTKNFDHRIYLGKGIYGDVQLRYRGNKFHTNYWTYPDYRDMKAIEFMARLRKKYMKEFKKLNPIRRGGKQSNG
ncbi:DUF4416 family protein [candidate division KSB1 bacterium]|nr:DUF4416 family protein [candidate division KSB1 bacterium]MBL7093191.1 DUF4416 family protein [candidate division KSB1 bacterium]